MCWICICNIIVGIVEIGCGCVSSKFGTPVKATSSKWIPLSRHHFSIAFPYTHYFLLFTVAILPSLFFVAPKVNISWTSPGQMFVPLMFPWIMFSSHGSFLRFWPTWSLVLGIVAALDQKHQSQFSDHNNREHVKNYLADFFRLGLGGGTPQFP